MSCLCELVIDDCPYLVSIFWHAPLKSLNPSAISSQLLTVVIERTINHCVEHLSFVYLSKIDDLEFLPKELLYHFKIFGVL